jgi:BirA family biotin operon repressor/biotin-[acetyl-CoA-carboxylase] ligase
MKKELFTSGFKKTYPFTFEIFDKLDSTNSWLHQSAKKGAAEWSIVVAEEQTAGRGRYHRQWESRPGLGLWFSVLLKPAIDPIKVNLINFLCAFSLATYLEIEIEKRTRNRQAIHLKWPNDIIIINKKVCGILLQVDCIADKVDYIVLGVGLNCNHNISDFSEEIRNKATSLKIETGVEWEREKLLRGFLINFYQNYSKYVPENLQEILQLYSQKVLNLSRRITVSQNTDILEGVFEGLTDEGYLILNQNGNRKLISTGELF